MASGHDKTNYVVILGLLQWNPVIRIIRVSVLSGLSEKKRHRPGLGIGDRRILLQLRKIFRQMFGTLRLFFIQTWSLFQNILL